MPGAVRTGKPTSSISDFRAGERGTGERVTERAPEVPPEPTGEIRPQGWESIEPTPLIDWSDPRNAEYLNRANQVRDEAKPAIDQILEFIKLINNFNQAKFNAGFGTEREVMTPTAQQRVTQKRAQTIEAEVLKQAMAAEHLRRIHRSYGTYSQPVPAGR